MNRKRWGYVLAATVAAIAILVAVGRFAPTRSESKESSRPALQSEPGRPAPLEAVGLDVGRSAEGRPIAARRWNGDDRPPILIVSGIHGDERSAVELARRLEKRWLAEPSRLEGHHVLFIPVVNPDGFEANTRKNAHGVDVNRNFPGGWVDSAPHEVEHGGTKPLTEPEALLLYRLVEDETPERILAIHSCRTCGGMNNYHGPARELADTMSAQNKYRPSSEWLTATPGSFGTHAGKTRGIPVVTLEIPRDVGEEEWEGNVRAVEAFVRFAAAATNVKGR
jgi:predicted deacylase